MARQSIKQLVIEVLRNVGLSVSEEEVENAINAYKLRGRNTNNLSFDEYFAGNMPEYKVAMNKDVPFSILQTLYYENPELFKSVFRLVKSRQKQQQEE